LARFNSALAAGNWDSAAGCLGDMHRLHLSTAENLAYLKVHLLASQQQWAELWNDANYAMIAQLHPPRAVRVALLTAFHNARLLAPESMRDINEVLLRFKEDQPRLGVLLEGRFGIADSPIVRVFGYHHALTNNIAGLNELLALEALDNETRTCLEELHRHIAPVLPTPVPVSWRQAIREQDFDTALSAATSLEQPEDRSFALLEIAALSRDRATAIEALAIWDSLADDQRKRLEVTESAVHVYLTFLRAEFPEQERTLTWDEWFELLLTAPDDVRLGPALDTLRVSAADATWSITQVERLEQHLLGLLDAPLTAGRVLARSAVATLMDSFLGDPRFPRDEFADLYEVFYVQLLEQTPSPDRALKLLRLAEGRLRHDSRTNEATLSNLRQWLGTPAPALERRVLDTFELLTEYGITREALADWYLEWISYLLDAPVTWDRLQMEAWLDFGQWLNVSETLLGRVRQRIDAEEKPAQDPLKRLPDGYRLAIFTLQSSAAERARSLLLARHPRLDIRLCHETEMNAQVRSLAQGVDAAVIVTTCLSHAIFYGIRPLLRSEPIYPESRGSTSIVRAVLRQAELTS
jgi:hypothetical protein